MLTEKVIAKLSKIHANIKQITISVDAATEDTYNIVRRGGDFTVLKNNIAFLNKVSSMKHVTLMYTFVVQSINYYEMKDFAHWMLQYPRSKIRFTRILPFGGMMGNYQSYNIVSDTHPAHLDFLAKLSESWCNNPKINWTNLKSFIGKKIS